jgi:hypothetical protein
LGTQFVVCFLDADLYLVTIKAECKHTVIVVGDAIIFQEEGLRTNPGATIYRRPTIGTWGKPVDTVQPKHKRNLRTTFRFIVGSGLR